MNPLSKLISQEFRIRVGAVSSPAALRRYLMHCKEVRDARSALAEGRISEQGILRLTDTLMEDFHRGSQFPHELALAALAVVLESRRTKFAEDYLIDLARLVKISEMDIGPRVAGICLQAWHQVARVVKRSARPRSRPPTRVSKHQAWVRMPSTDVAANKAVRKLIIGGFPRHQRS